MKTADAADAVLTRGYPPATDVDLQPIRWRVLNSRQRSVARLVNSGLFGEDVAVQWLRQHRGDSSAHRVGGELPIDVLADRHAIEVKTGLASNSPNAQQWRLTFSAARGPELRLLLSMTEAERTAYFRAKQQRILERKQELLTELRRLTQRALDAATLTLIVHVERRDCDVFWFEGWWQRIGWQTEQARQGYVGSYHVGGGIWDRVQ